MTAIRLSWQNEEFESGDNCVVATEKHDEIVSLAVTTILLLLLQRWQVGWWRQLRCRCRKNNKITSLVVAATLLLLLQRDQDDKFGGGGNFAAATAKSAR